MAAPPSAIRLSDPPFCGDPINMDLPAEIQQYMVIVFDKNVSAAKVAAECGCPTPTAASLRLAFTDDLAGEADFADRVGRMSLPTVDQRAAQARLVGALQTLVSRERTALATGQYGSQPMTDAFGGESAASGQFRAALGMPQSTCAFVRP